MDPGTLNPCMNLSTAVRAASIYRLLSTISFLVGLTIAGIGAYFGGGIQLLQALPPGPPVLAVFHLVDAVPAMILAVIGFAVWQFGSSVAFYYTMAGTTAREAGEEFETEKVKSEVLAVLDDRLSEMHEDVEATRRAVEGDAGGATAGGSTAGSTGGSTTGTADRGGSGETDRGRAGPREEAAGGGSRSRGGTGERSRAGDAGDDRSRGGGSDHPAAPDDGDDRRASGGSTLGTGNSGR